MYDSNEVLSVLAELGIIAYHAKRLGWAGCLRWHVIAKEFFMRVQHKNVRSRDDGENQEGDFDSLAMDSAYCADEAWILSRPIFFETNGVTGDLLEIEQGEL